ncbi:unnamed protein product [Cyclocybe aegerita]|uniref:chitinase n=1 Tax=Cyclocybe aegerita TaxID=1973307 RepID=A0A8S0WLV5_CYCAE|nr:unnamed protein product [Cyclocybe aegerita]
MAFERTTLFLTLFSVFLSQCFSALGYDTSRSDNLAVYWGQNSYGATHPDPSSWQKRLSTYCQDDVINAIPLAFLHVFFSTGGLPEINMANICNNNDQPVFSGTSLANCQFLASDIKACQARGKIVTLSLGGATGAASFTSDAQAEAFATTVWNLFLGGSSSTRPFGDAVLDGVDLDIEGGSGAYLPTFVRKIRSLSSGASKKYYLTAAPQCPFPDAYLGSVINAVGFDAIYVQFITTGVGELNNYNNQDVSGSVIHALNIFDSFRFATKAWNFATWDNWAKATSPNKSVKIFLGAPAASTAAGSGYVDANTLSNIAKAMKASYSSFGGVMLWDASQAYGNGRYDVAIKNALGGAAGTPIPTTTTRATTSTATTARPTTTTTTARPTTTTTPGTGSCAGVAPWTSTVVYLGGAQVTYNGHLWQAQWWSQADTPGGAAGVWIDKGACTSRLATAQPNIAASTAAPAVKDAKVSEKLNVARRSSRIFKE